MTWTRRAVLAAGAASALAPGLAACAPGWPDVGGRVRVGTGNAGAVFDRYGAALAAQVHARMPDVDTEALVTGGSVANVEAITAGEAEVAFCLGDTAVLALAGEAPFDRAHDLTAVARLYDSFLQFLVPADSPVRTPADLAGRRVAGGQQGSGTHLTVVRALAAAGVAEDDVDLVDPPLQESLAALESGEVDALCFVSGFPIPAVVELATRMPLRALDLGALVAPMVRAHGPQYVAGPMAPSPYRLPAAVQTVSIKTYFVAAPGLADDLVSGIAAVIFDDQAAIARRVPDVRQPTLAAGVFTEPVPLHPGSLRWFRERDAAAG